MPRVGGTGPWSERAVVAGADRHACAIRSLTSALVCRSRLVHAAAAWIARGTWITPARAKRRVGQRQLASASGGARPASATAISRPPCTARARQRRGAKLSAIASRSALTARAQPREGTRAQVRAREHHEGEHQRGQQDQRSALKRGDRPDQRERHGRDQRDDEDRAPGAGPGTEHGTAAAHRRQSVLAESCRWTRGLSVK